MGIVQHQLVSLPYLQHPAYWATLDSGHQVLVVNKPGEVVHVHTVVRTGSVNETDENTGISHFLEHLMFKGTERFPAGAFDRILEGIGSRVNASTSRDYTQYFVTLPKGVNGEYYRLALDLHADMLLRALLPSEEIGPPFDPEKRERMVVIEEIKMGKDNPWRNAIQKLSELLYPTHPYRREVIGTAQVIATIPEEQIRAYYRAWYQPANMVTILTGDLQSEDVVADVEMNFRFDAPSAISHPEFPVEQRPTSPRIATVAMPLNVTYVVLGFLGPPSTDLRATIALDAVSMILGEGKSSRLFRSLIEQLPDTPFVDIGSTHWTLRDSSNIISYGIARPGEDERVFSLLRDEVSRIRTVPPTEEEFQRTITRLEAQFAAQSETASGISFGIADSMARLNDPSNYTQYLPILHSLTPEDLAHYACMYMDPETLCAVTVSSPGAEKPGA